MCARDDDDDDNYLGQASTRSSTRVSSTTDLTHPVAQVRGLLAAAGSCRWQYHSRLQQSSCCL